VHAEVLPQKTSIQMSTLIARLRSVANGKQTSKPKRKETMHQLSHLQKILLGIALVLGTGLVTTTPVVATPPSGGVTTEILSVCNFGKLDIFAETALVPGSEHPVWRAFLNTNHATDVYVVRVTFPPGGSTGWHRHPGPSLITVVSGTLVVYDKDCNGTVYPAGSCFIDNAHHLHLVRNEGSVPAVDIATQLVPAGFPRRQEAGNPGCAGID
jgi:quercetin dioxygenase-like cupin family protein